MTPTKVIIDAVSLGGEAGRSGIGRYVANLIRAVDDRDDIDLSVLAVEPCNFPAGIRLVTVKRRWRDRRRALYEHELRMIVDLRRSPEGILHSPSVDPPRWPGRPYVQTLHDVIPLVSTDADLVPLRRLWKRWAGRYRSAAAVIADSRFTAEEGIRVLHLDPARVHVVHLGVGPEYCAGPRPDEEGQPYVLLVAEYSQRKGFGDAFAAIAALAEAGLPHRLRVAGGLRPHNESELRALAAHAPRPDRIELLGYVDDLPAVYRGADAVVVPSRYEGFGLPALEAMACGVPVVAYENTSLPEVLGGAGVLVHDGDVAALSASLRCVVESDTWRAELVEAGLARSAAFTWERAARETAAVYREVAG